MRKRYPKYKPSGVEWLGDVPEHWEVKQLKYSAFRVDEKVEADDENPVLYVGLEHIESWTGRLLPLDPDLVPTGISNRFRAGDMLFGKLRPYLAKACNVDVKGLCSSELLVLRAASQDRRFLLYRLLADGFISLVDASTYGAKMPRASWDFIGSRALPVPPIEEQGAVADFLDRETAKIYTLMSKKRTLIERLKEKRTALISRTVTRGLPPDAARAAGLDPYPKLKPSGIDWLGAVPAHWEIAPMRYLIIGGTRNGMYKPPSDFDDDGIPMVQMSEAFAEPVLVNIAKDRVRVSATELAGWSLLEGDLLFGRRSLVFSGSGKCVLVGRLPEPHVFESSLIRVRARRAIADPKYLFHFLGSAYGRAQVLSATKQVTISGVDSQQIKSILVLLPSISEQRAITDFIDRESTKIDRMVAKVETAIERLREYRMALITAAVTGKIDVREALGHREGSVSRSESARMQA